MKTSTRNTIELLCFIQCDTKMREPRTIKTTKQNIVCTRFMCVRTFLFFYCFIQVPFTIYTVSVKVYCAAIIIIKFFVQFCFYKFLFTWCFSSNLSTNRKSVCVCVFTNGSAVGFKMITILE